jgi:cellulose synthase/poly-beta-1,6-N-acetylglucosamine synthase-like glycosyltransferase
VLEPVQATSVVLLVLFLSYLTAITRAFLRRGPGELGSEEDFSWHIFVPCRDEEAVIAQTMVRLRTDFPGAHVWVVDDDSDDRTGAIVAERAAYDPYVHLVSRRRPFARTGKGDALNSAYHQLNDYLGTHAYRDLTIVCVVDADGHMAPDALRHVASTGVFGTASVGAAQISVRMRNRNDLTPLAGRGRLANAFARYLVRMQDIEFRTAIAAMQNLRTLTRSVGLGGNGQFTRLAVLDKIAAEAGQPWHGALLEDYELGLHVLLAGYENRYVDDTYVSQEGLTDFRRLITQRTRWSQGNIQCVKYLPALVRSPHLTSAAVLEAGYYLLLPFIQLIGIVLWPFVFYLALHNTHATGQSFGAWLGSAWWFLLLVFVLGIVPFAMWGPIYRAKCEPRISRCRSVLWGLGLCVYIYYLYLSVTRAFFRLMLRRSGWAKTRRNAEDLSVGAIAKEA